MDEFVDNDFLDLHFKLNKDTEFLFSHICDVADRIMEKEKDADEEKSIRMAITLVCYPYMNKKEMSGDELFDTYNSILMKIQNRIH